mmetsp:Transcript_36215/g.26871  ORF Transcript_36215/g.26871 Transcript_36215/m.26871 type:complete len:154 (+) Transcript_36215:209-670(+)
MKLGNSLFYNLENKRLAYHSTFEVFPYLTGLFGVLFFCGFAVMKPLTNKLYKETLYSILMGSMVAYSYVYYKKRQYNQCVDETYELIKKRFQRNPALADLIEGNQIVKNFGLSKYTEFDDDEEIMEDTLGVFEGGVEMEQRETRQRISDFFYG